MPGARTGGKLAGTGDTSRSMPTGVAPGRYTVTVTVADKKHEVDCPTDITVLKKTFANGFGGTPKPSTLFRGPLSICDASDPDANNDL